LSAAGVRPSGPAAAADDDLLFVFFYVDFVGFSFVCFTASHADDVQMQRTDEEEEEEEEETDDVIRVSAESLGARQRGGHR
jgi:hypothetical protein